MLPRVSLAPPLASMAGALAAATALLCCSPLAAQPAGSQDRVIVRSDVQEADADAGTIVARGNVEIDYPAREIRATAAQVQLFRQEQRLVLSGNVVVVQRGNSIKAEQVVYLIEEDRFIATPKSQQQVESVYVIPANDDAPAGNGAPGGQTAQ